MGMTDNLLSTGQWLFTALLFVLVLIAALRSVDWRAFRNDDAAQHTLFGAAVVLGFVWQLRAGISPGLAIHIFGDRKSTRLNSSHVRISYAVFCLKKKITISISY